MSFKVNQTLYIHVNSIDEDESSQLYKSRIAEIGKDYLYIEIPIHAETGRWKRLYAGDQLNVHFVSETSGKNYFPSTVIGFQEEGALRLAVIKKPNPSEITQEHRRTFLRVPASLEIAVKINEQIRFAALTEDVSGGGISFVCKAYVPVSPKDEIDCWLLMQFRNGTIDHAHFIGEVVRIKPKDQEHKLVMLAFSDIADVERQKVIRFCFERQIESRKKE